MSDILQRLRCTVPCQDMTAKAGCHCAEAADTITSLREEVERLKTDLEDLRDPKLSHMRLENGTLDMALVAPVVEGLATALGGWFMANGGKNYVEMRLHDRHETNQVYVVTVQKSGAKTPHDLRKDAEAEVERLRAGHVVWQNAYKTGRNEPLVQAFGHSCSLLTQEEG